MYKVTKQNFNSLILGIFLLIILPYLLFVSALLPLVGLFSITNYLNFLSPYYISILFYVASIIISVLAILGIKKFDKKSWPHVNGEIIDLKISRDPLSLIGIWTLKYIYKFNYDGKNHIKGTFSNIAFSNKYEASMFIRKIDWSGKKYLPVYVFKSYPSLSSTESKTNILSILLLYIILITNFMLIFLGFLARIATFYDFNPNQYAFIQLKTIFDLYVSKMDLLLILLPILILVLLAIFFIESVRLLIKNKIFLFYTRINPDKLTEEPPFELILNKTCSHCESKNQVDVKFCTNCGKKFY